jgi:vacuolar protein sorting-associated protein 72
MNALTTAAGVRKRVKIAPTPASGDKESATKPSKKKERGSWLPDGKSGPSRTSTRWQTKANTKTTLLRVAKSAEESAKTRRRLQKLQREKEKDKPKELTQADRLAEAERTERKNAKSLNRWEAMEKKRAEEQAAKLAALKDRKLDGPVISSWSGAAQWLGPKLVKVGGKETNFEPAAEPKKRGRKPKGYWEAMDRKASLVAENSALRTPQEETATPAPSEAAIDSGAPSEAAANASEAAPTPLTFTAPQNPDNFLNGIQELVLEPSEPSPAPAPASNEAPQTSTQAVPPVTYDPQYHPPLLLPPVSETSTRNLVMLESFDKLTAQDRVAYAFFYNNRKTPKPVKHAQELCPITSLPARYRDPSTGVPYANAYAYRKLQDLKKHQFIWSSMLGCFVGASGIVARGVPEGFSGA